MLPLCGTKLQRILLATLIRIKVDDAVLCKEMRTGLGSRRPHG